MKTIKAIITPKSSFSSGIHSDTLFGAFCWNYLDKYGQEELEKLLKNYSIVFSNIFPKDKLPCPIIPNTGNDYINIDEYQNVKKLKKIKYIPAVVFREELTDKSISEAKEKILQQEKQEKEEWKTNGKDWQPFSVQQIITRNAINRNTGTVLEGALFTDTETFYRVDSKLVFYVMFDENIISAEKVKAIIETMGMFGVGKDKSIGKGAFSVEFSEDDLPKAQDAKFFITLSNGLPSDDDCNLQYGKTITKFSKHGRGSLFLKNPAQMYTEGSIFRFNKRKDFYGKYLDNVSNENGHLHHACLFPLFIDIKLADEEIGT